MLRLMAVVLKKPTSWLVRLDDLVLQIRLSSSNNSSNQPRCSERQIPRLALTPPCYQTRLPRPGSVSRGGSFQGEVRGTFETHLQIIYDVFIKHMKKMRK